EEAEEVRARRRGAQRQNQQIGEQAGDERGGNEREIALERAERQDVYGQEERQRAEEQLPAADEKECEADQDPASDEDPCQTQPLGEERGGEWVRLIGEDIYIAEFGEAIRVRVQVLQRHRD